MEKNSLLLLGSLFGALLLDAPISATENVLKDPSMDSLPVLMQKNITLRPYVKDLINGSSLPERAQILTRVESPELFEQLNFEELIQGVFRDKAWTPHIHAFRDADLQELLHPYAPKLLASDTYMIFLANVLYDAGSRIYDQTSNPAHLEHAASLGHAEAQLKMFHVDFKIRKLQEAKSYLFCSAAQGHPEALLTLSEAYQRYWGIEVPRDLNTAKLLCQEAAGLGNSDARFRIEVAMLTHGFFGSDRNYQQGVHKAKELADSGNDRAKRFIESIKRSSGDALQEGNDYITDGDLDFLRVFLGWRDVFDD